MCMWKCWSACRRSESCCHLIQANNLQGRGKRLGRTLAKAKLYWEKVQLFLQELFLFAYPANKTDNTDEEYSVIVYLESFMYKTFFVCFLLNKAKYARTTMPEIGFFLDKV